MLTWWQILLVFVGIPAAIFVITVAVFRFATARVPDAMLRAEQQQDENSPSPEEHEDTSEDAEDV